MMEQDERIRIIWSNRGNTHTEEFFRPEMAESRLLQIYRRQWKKAESDNDNSTEILRVVKGRIT